MAARGDRTLLDARVHEGWVGCIDFGTAYSKIALIRNNRQGQVSQRDVHVLAIGPLRTGGVRDYFLPSALYVLQDRIHIGEQAFRMHARHGDVERRRFESPKQLISSVNTDLLDTPATQAEDPTQSFKRRELLLLLLGFLSYRFEDALRAVGDFKGRLPWLRVSRPGWSPDSERTGERLLSELMGQSLVLARTIGPKFDDEAGLRVQDARSALDAALSVSDAGEAFQRKLLRSGSGNNCIERGFVPEATAVAASAIRPEARKGRLFTVADIGAGTSDFGAFISAPGRDGRGVFGEFVSERRLVEQAGNHLDALVFSYLKEANELNEGVPDDVAYLARLRRDLRVLKETLFREHELLGDFVGTLSEFLVRPQVVQFISRLEAAFAVPFARACEEARTSRGRTVHVILTGGGATLPFIRALPSRSPSNTPIVTEPDFPPWIEDVNWAAIYRQLAVAIGGAMPVMPRQT